MRRRSSLRRLLKIFCERYKLVAVVLVRNVTLFILMPRRREIFSKKISQCLTFLFLLRGVVVLKNAVWINGTSFNLAVEFSQDDRP